MFCIEAKRLVAAMQARGRDHLMVVFRENSIRCAFRADRLPCLPLETQSLV